MSIESGWDGKAIRIPYPKYPNLPGVLLHLIKSGHQAMMLTTNTAAAESVFPALDIIRRAGPPESLIGEISGHITPYLSSQVWHVRDMAARTLCSCLLHDRWLPVIEDLIKDARKIQGGQQRNRLHGILLTLKFVIEKLSEVMADQLKRRSNFGWVDL
jgi:hypothetical protein